MRNEWNNFWISDQSKQFTKVSWSKRRIMNILDCYVKTEMIVLDAGCGSGFFRIISYQLAAMFTRLIILKRH